MITEETRTAILETAQRLLDQPGPSALQNLMAAIRERAPHYQWVGIYWLDGQTLRLGPYVGAATDHTEIPVGRGVCGVAVAENRNQVIADVRELDNYLACSLETRSEIVVLIRDGERILGQIDADGHEVGDFNETDEQLLAQLAELIAARPNLHPQFP